MISLLSTSYSAFNMLKGSTTTTETLPEGSANTANSFSENARWLGRKIVQFFNQVLSWVKRTYEKIAIKVKELWPKVQPYLKKAVDFLRSPAGICCISGLVIVICVIKTIDSDTLFKKAFWITLGLVAAIFLGIVAQKANFFISSATSSLV